MKDPFMDDDAMRAQLTVTDPVGFLKSRDIEHARRFLDMMPPDHPCRPWVVERINHLELIEDRAISKARHDQLMIWVLITALIGAAGVAATLFLQTGY